MMNISNDNDEYPYNYKIELVMNSGVSINNEISVPLNLQPLAKSRTDFKKCCITLQYVHISKQGATDDVDKVFYVVMDYNFTNSYKLVKGESNYQKSKILGTIHCYPNQVDNEYKCLSAHTERVFFEEIPQMFNLTFRFAEFDGSTVQEYTAGNAYLGDTSNNYLTGSNIRIILNMDLY